MEVAVPPRYNLQHRAKNVLQHVRYTRRRLPSRVRRIWGAFRSTYRTGWLCNSVCAMACLRLCSAARTVCNWACFAAQSTISLLISLVVLQVNSPPATLKIMASFELTLGLCIWECLKICNSVTNTDAEPFWPTGADMLSAEPIWDLLHLTAPQEVSNLLALPADTIVPGDFAAKASDTHSPDWSTVDSSVHPLLLLLHAYMETAHVVHLVHSDTSMASAMATNIGKVTANVIKSQPTYASRLLSSATPSLHIQKLRAALLLLKLVALLSTIKVPDTQLHNAKTSIFTAFGAMARSIQQQLEQEGMRESEMEEARRLSRHIAKMAIPAMKRLSTANPTGSFCCSLMLQRLMISSTAAAYRTVASHVASVLVHDGQFLVT